MSFHKRYLGFSLFFLFLTSNIIQAQPPTQDCTRKVNEHIYIDSSSAKLPYELRKKGYKINSQNWPEDLIIDADINLWLQPPSPLKGEQKGFVFTDENKPIHSSVTSDKKQFLLNYSLGASVLCITDDINPENLDRLVIIASGYDTSTQLLDGQPATNQIFKKFKTNEIKQAVCLIDLPAEGINFTINSPLLGGDARRAEGAIYAPCLEDFSSPYDAYYKNYLYALKAIFDYFENIPTKFFTLSIATVPALKATLELQDQNLKAIYLLSPYTGIESDFRRDFYYSWLGNSLARAKSQTYLGGKNRNLLNDAIRLSHNKEILQTEIIRLFSNNASITEQVNPTHAFIHDSNTYLQHLYNWIEEENIDVNNFNKNTEIITVIFKNDHGIVHPLDKKRGINTVLENRGLNVQLKKIPGFGHNMLTEPSGQEFILNELLSK